MRPHLTGGVVGTLVAVGWIGDVEGLEIVGICDGIPVGACVGTFKTAPKSGNLAERRQMVCGPHVDFIINEKSAFLLASDPGQIP
jgi:hypothetical protein